MGPPADVLRLAFSPGIRLSGGACIAMALGPAAALLDRAVDWGLGPRNEGAWFDGLAWAVRIITQLPWSPCGGLALRVCLVRDALVWPREPGAVPLMTCCRGIRKLSALGLGGAPLVKMERVSREPSPDGDQVNFSGPHGRLKIRQESLVLRRSSAIRRCGKAHAAA